MPQILYKDAIPGAVWYARTDSRHMETDSFAGYLAATNKATAGRLGSARCASSLRPSPRVRGAGAGTTGIPAGVWIAIVVDVPAIVVFVILRRRRTGEEDV
jgi:hypothetical protein